MKLEKLRTPLSLFLHYTPMSLAIVLALVAGSLSSARADTDSKSPIVVGVSLPLTGPAAIVGIPIQKGMMLALEELPQPIRQRITVVYEDDVNQPKTAVAAFQKLTRLNKAQVFVNAASNTAKAISPLADAQKIPFIAIASDYAVVQGRTHAVNLWVTPEEETKLLFPEAIKRGYRKIARVSSLHDANLSYKPPFDNMNAASGSPIAIVGDEDFALDTSDFKPFINKLKTKGQLDAIYVNLFVGQVGVFARQVRELGITAPLFGCEMFEDPDAVKASNGALLDQWYVQGDDGSTEFIKRFSARFPEQQTVFGSANGYDSIGLIGAALASGADSSESINAFLKQVKDHSGALGVYSSTADNRFTLPAVLKVVTADGFKKLNQ